MKLDPNNNDAISSVGDDLGNGVFKYTGMVVGIDGCVYGIPCYSKRVIKYDPINDITSFVGEEDDEYFMCGGNGVLGRDECIYALAGGDQALKMDTTNNSHCFVGNTVESDHADSNGRGDGILGIDGCIYWPPANAAQILKYDPHLNLTSLVGDDLGHDENKWSGGCAAPDGVIYCILDRANRFLSIDGYCP